MKVESDLEVCLEIFSKGTYPPLLIFARLSLGETEHVEGSIS